MDEMAHPDLDESVRREAAEALCDVLNNYPHDARNIIQDLECGYAGSSGKYWANEIRNAVVAEQRMLLQQYFEQKHAALAKNYDLIAVYIWKTVRTNHIKAFSMERIRNCLIEFGTMITNYAGNAYSVVTPLHYESTEEEHSD